MNAMASQINYVSIAKPFVQASTKETSKLRVTGLCEGNSPVTGEFPAQRPVTRKMFSFDDVIMDAYTRDRSRYKPIGLNELTDVSGVILNNSKKGFPVRSFEMTFSHFIRMPGLSPSVYSSERFHHDRWPMRFPVTLTNCYFSKNSVNSIQTECVKRVQGMYSLPMNFLCLKHIDQHSKCQYSSIWFKMRPLIISWRCFPLNDTECYWKQELKYFIFCILFGIWSCIVRN